MKIGIMSMQRILNYGSYLIALALKNTFSQMGHEVEFVDFKISPCLVHTSTDMHLQDLTDKDQYYMNKVQNFKKEFKDCYQRELGITERNERPQLDVLVIGSDEVFNCLQCNPDVGYSLELFGKNANAKKIISYAASCGTTTYEDLKKFNKTDEISNLLKKFDAISVRDTNTADFVEKLTGIIPYVNLDPVLLYDFSSNIVDNVNIDNYIIVYSYSLRLTKEENMAIKQFAEKHHKKIVCLGMYQPCCNIFVPASPLEVLSYFKKADYIFTDTFHGSVFSIKTKRPFATIIRESNNGKLGDLLERYKLTDRRLFNLDDLESILLKPIDYTSTYDIIENEKQKALDYFIKNLA